MKLFRALQRVALALRQLQWLKRLPKLTSAFTAPALVLVVSCGIALAFSPAGSSIAELPRYECSIMHDLNIFEFASVLADSIPKDTTKFPFFPPPWETADSTKKSPTDSSKLGMDSLQLKAMSDSLLALSDTSGLVMDSTWVVYLDSSARIEQFLHHRSDVPSVELFPKPNYSLYLDVASPAYKRELELDTTGRFITVRERVNGLDVKVPVTVTLDEYIKQRFEEEKRNNWRSFVYEYTVKDKGDALSNLFGNITNIEIPVPANPLLSIFGKPVINLKVTGAVDIHAAFRSQSSDQIQLDQRNAARNEPDFNQDVQINVNGMVGDKLSIIADWNTQRTFEYENSLKIKYTGYDDEIVQSVEAGNVSLQVPSLVGSSQALFGIKAKLQAGPLTLTTLLSQKKGQARDISINGGSQAREQQIFPFQYSTSHYFLDTLYRKYFERLHANPTTPIINDEIQRHHVVEADVDVYVSISGSSQNQNKRSAMAFIDLPPRDSARYDDSYSNAAPLTGVVQPGYFMKLDRTQYKVNGYGGYISLSMTVAENQAIAVAYSTDEGKFYGELPGVDTSGGRKLILKLIKPDVQLNPSMKPAWDLQLRNIYSLGGKDLKRDNFHLDIYYKPNGQTEETTLKGVPLIQILGLDRFSTTGEERPDNVFDFLSSPPITIDVERAEIIFPTLRPFDTGMKIFFAAHNDPITDSLLFPDIYDTTMTAAQNNPQKGNLYVIKVTSQTAQSNRFSLGGMNIVEGSVRVYANDQLLEAIKDYTIDYIIGEVVIKNELYLQTGYNISVKYEQNDLFQLASKTLIGARGELAVSQDSRLGFTIMNLNQETLSDKVRLGEEPTRNTIVGVDGATAFNLPFLTTAIDALPLLKVKEMSTMRISGEGAYIIPDANTKKSPIQGDGGTSIAYLDDFEGARRTIPLSISYTSWKSGSPPDYTLLGAISDSAKMWSKAKLEWFNNRQDLDPVYTHDIWPNRSVRRGQDLISVLTMDYFPNRRGMYNFSPNLQRDIHTDPRKNWNGVMRYVSTTAGNLVEQNINYLEIWFQASSNDIADLQRGRLYVDLGRISEDVIANKELNSEDIVKTPQNPNGIPNGALSPEEDLGLDMLANEQERVVYSSFVTANAGDPDVDPNDPSGDDFAFSTGGTDFTKINGVENNRNSVDGLYPNTEDLNGNGIVDLTSTYLEYEVPLDTAFYDSTNTLRPNTLIVGGGKNKWFQIRVPLTDASRVISPDQTQTAQSILQNVQYVRMWVSGFTKPVRIRIAEFDLVGNQWLEMNKNDSTMKVSVVNIEDNPNYTSPPGVIRERDRTQPDQEIFGNEQSLSLLVRNLAQGDSRQAVKFFTIRPIDLFNYKALKMFIHGDQTFQYIDTSRYDAEVFIRFGSDTNNYYEYRQPIRQGWDAMNDMNILFSELTSVKAARDSANRLYRRPVENGPPGATYGILGNPALTQIRYIGIGVTNPRQTSKPFLTGDVWVNELRVIDVDNSSGYSYRFDTQVKLSDFGNVAFNYSKKDPNFHGIDQRFGDRITQESWALNTSFILDKFFPADWAGTALQFGYSHQEGLTKPKYLPATDVLVEKAAASAAARAPQGQQSAAADKVITESQSLRVSESFGLPNIRFVLPVQAWYIRETINKLSYGFNYTRAHERSPALAERRTWSWDFKIAYSENFPTDLYIQPFKSLFNGIFLLNDFKDWKLYYLPVTGFNTNLTAQRQRTSEVSRALATPPRENRTFGVTKSIGFGWKLTEGGLLSLSGDYGLSVSRDLLYLDNDSIGRGFSEIVKTIFFRGRDGQYGQRVTVNSKPKIPNILDIPKYFDLTASYSASYSWRNTFQADAFGKGASWDNSINISSTFRLKALTDPWFQTTEEPAPPPAQRPPQPPPRPRLKEGDEVKDDTLKQTKGDTLSVEKPSSGKNALKMLKSLTKYFIKIPFLDYENIQITFTEGNRSANGGLVGGTGFQNFWGRWPFAGSRPENGPSRLYQLGLVSDPSGEVTFSPSSRFPFIGWKTSRGVRAPNTTLIDQYSQNNNITLKTTRPLWEGATLELNWRVGWQFNKTTTLQTDSLGIPTPGTTTTTGSVDRSYFSLPPFFLFKSFKSNLEQVGKKYEQLRTDRSPDVALAESFEQGLEALPFLSKVFGQYVPRPNWTLRWSGLEKIGGLSSIFQQLSLDHGYNGSFKRTFRSAPDGSERTDIEQVVNGFSPLLGLNMTFKDFLKGNFSGNLRFSSTTTYDLNITSANITETFTQEIALSLTYSRRGFQIPFFGVNLNNDVDMTLTFSRSRNSRRLHDPNYLSSNQEGIPLDGTTRTSLEPRMRYVLSSRVSASLFYRYSKMAPDEGGSTIPGTSTNEAGIDIHIAIQ